MSAQPSALRDESCAQAVVDRLDACEHHDHQIATPFEWTFPPPPPD